MRGGEGETMVPIFGFVYFEGFVGGGFVSEYFEFIDEFEEVFKLA